MLRGDSEIHWTKEVGGKAARQEEKEKEPRED